MKFTNSVLKKMELLFEECGYKVRYEKGNFTPDYCILEQKKVVVVNKYFSTDAKVESLINIISKIKISKETLSEESRIIYNKIAQLKLDIK